jgi:hypothetical protein
MSFYEIIPETLTEQIFGQMPNKLGLTVSFFITDKDTFYDNSRNWVSENDRTTAKAAGRFCYSIYNSDSPIFAADMDYVRYIYGF